MAKYFDKHAITCKNVRVPQLLARLFRSAHDKRHADYVATAWQTCALGAHLGVEARARWARRSSARRALAPKPNTFTHNPSCMVLCAHGHGHRCFTARAGGKDTTRESTAQAHVQSCVNTEANCGSINVIICIIIVIRSFSDKEARHTCARYKSFLCDAWPAKQHTPRGRGRARYPQPCVPKSHNPFIIYPEKQLGARSGQAARKLMARNDERQGQQARKWTRKPSSGPRDQPNVIHA